MVYGMIYLWYWENGGIAVTLHPVNTKNVFRN